MSTNALGWEPLLALGVSNTAVLRGALFTTYDRPDGQLMVEQVLRTILRIDRQPSAELSEHGCFLAEMAERVHALRDEIVVVSSAHRDEGIESTVDGAGQYQWLFNCIRPLTVGRTGKAVQHAKLWMLHWEDAAAGTESLEIVVSSANLTYASFSSQIQAAWRTTVPLQPRASEAQRRSWGILPHFLRELGESTGDAARVARLGDLLARAQCPDDVTFLASVPGRHSAKALRKTPWGAAGLSAIVPPGHGSAKVSVSAPSIGDWSEKSVARWAEYAQSAPDRVSLVWVEQEHDWARPGRLCMTLAARTALLNAGVTLVKYGAVDDGDGDFRVHEEHNTRDLRWSHAKLYALVRGRSRRLIITSANFSTSAWGRQDADGLHITNFELGVCLPKLDWPFSGLIPFDDANRAAVADRSAQTDGGAIEWGFAEWDGTMLTLQCRCLEPHALTTTLVTRTSEASLGKWATDTRSRILEGTVGWSAEQGIPVHVLFTCGTQTVRVPVYELQADIGAVVSAVTGLSAEDALALTDDLLFERFGSIAVSERAVERRLVPTGPAEADGGPQEVDADKESGAGDSYAVAEFMWARQQLGIVDAWQRQVELEATRTASRYSRAALAREGQLLVAAFERRATQARPNDSVKKAGARLALEEMRLRLSALEE